MWRSKNKTNHSRHFWKEKWRYTGCGTGSHPGGRFAFYSFVSPSRPACHFVATPATWHMCLPVPTLRLHLYPYLGYLLVCQTACVSYLGCVSFNFPLASGTWHFVCPARLTCLAIMRSKIKITFLAAKNPQSFSCLDSFHFAIYLHGRSL